MTLEKLSLEGLQNEIGSFPATVSVMLEKDLESGFLGLVPRRFGRELKEGESVDFLNTVPFYTIPRVGTTLSVRLYQTVEELQDDLDMFAEMWFGK